MSEPLAATTRATLRLAAPAKLNLSLAIVGRRPDGFHLLASVFVLLELADELLLTPDRAGLRIASSPHDGVDADERNLAWRGLLAGLDSGLGAAPGAEPGAIPGLELHKHVPVAAGLGGGSSDAAAAWRLARRWSAADERPSADELVALGTIGADVPFFAAQLPAAYVTGIGERIEAIPPPTTREVVLALPGFGLSTAAVFAELRPSDWSASAPAHQAITGRNDLLPAALRLRPELDDLSRLVRAHGGEPHLTGSGPTIYSLSDDAQRADRLAARLRGAGVRTLRTRIALAATTIEPMSHEEADSQ